MFKLLYIKINELGSQKKNIYWEYLQYEVVNRRSL